MSAPAALLVAVAAAGAALTLALAGSVARDGVHGRSRTSAPGAIRTASYTLVSDTSGTVRLTINPGKLFAAAALQRDLARYGIPAKVTSGSLCTSDPAPAGLSRVATIGTGERETITFHPAAVRPGTELSLGSFRARFGQAAYVVLIDTGSYACTRALPTGRFAAGARLGYYRLP